MPIRILGPEFYYIEDPYNIERWMCPKCGFVFDFRDEIHNEPRTTDSYDPFTGEYDSEAYCPRCEAPFASNPLIPLEVQRHKIKEPTEITFYVEDSAQKCIIEAIAQQLGKSISIKIMGNAQTVKALFNAIKSEDGWTNCYFVTDGDNKSDDVREPNFIHLDKYCIENYLLDFEIWSEIAGQTIDLKEKLLKILQEHRHEITKGSPLLELLFDRLKVDDLDSFLSYIDVSRLILPKLLRSINMKKYAFIKLYVEKCNTSHNMESILPVRIVEAIKRA